MKELILSRGYPYPLGASISAKGINFAIFSRHATAISLCLFKPKGTKPFVELPLDPDIHKTGDVWHVFISNLSPHYFFGYRVGGPYDPLKGHIFDNRNILLDPYAKGVKGPQKWGCEEMRPLHTSIGSILSTQPFDWGNDRHPNIPLKELIIYEMHVRGFTQDPSSGVKNRGTFSGLLEKIPHLKKLGINAVELMPIFEFNECDNPRTHPETGEKLYNYWGYSTVNFFSLMRRFGTIDGDPIQEFKTLVKELHSHNIEVILDVVYNHTCEGNSEGPILSFKGLENSVYYMLTPNGDYYNFSGCGNTLNCNNPIVRDLIRDSLRYWVTEMHVDGFRFDLASVLVRGTNGLPLSLPPLIESITLDPILANTKLIAEAWDAGGLYQVGSFPGLGVWAEWNGQYRDSIRKFVKGTDGEVGLFATRICGSQDLYGHGRNPGHSINFITAHDGFSLQDLVSYNTKHNEMNGEYNCDGSDDNNSWNCGVEGSTDDKAISFLRARQMKNFHTILMISQGVPMILMGDEYGHTKHGNNNSWCHDSRLNWFQWDSLEENESFFRFFCMMIDFRKNHPVLTRSQFLEKEDIQWHGLEPNHPDWNKSSRFIACTLPDRLNDYTLYLAFNAFYEEIMVHIPQTATPWYQMVYTGNMSPKDIYEEKIAPRLRKHTFIMAPYSVLILKSFS